MNLIEQEVIQSFEIPEQILLFINDSRVPSVASGLCEECGKIFYCRSYVLGQLTCSKKCMTKVNIGCFKKGQKVWCYGTKGIVKANNGSFKKGMPMEIHNNWKGDNVGYWGVHDWINKIRGKANSCEHCGTLTAKRYEWANKSGAYKRDLIDWISLCKSCHLKYDNCGKKAWITRRWNMEYHAQAN